MGKTCFTLTPTRMYFVCASQYIDDLMMLSKMIRAACDDEKTMRMYLDMSEVAKHEK